MNLAKIYNSNWKEKHCTEITLNEGDILYHPAGIWHSVEAIEDSISINFSLRHTKVADIVLNAVSMLLNKDLKMREPLRITDSKNLLD